MKSFLIRKKKVWFVPDAFSSSILSLLTWKMMLPYLWMLNQPLFEREGASLSYGIWFVLHVGLDFLMRSTSLVFSVCVSCCVILLTESRWPHRMSQALLPPCQSGKHLLKTNTIPFLNVSGVYQWTHTSLVLSFMIGYLLLITLIIST